MTTPHVTPPAGPLATGWGSPDYPPNTPQPRRRLRPWMIAALAVVGTLAVIFGVVILGAIALVAKASESQSAEDVPSQASTTTAADTGPSHGVTPTATPTYTSVGDQAGLPTLPRKIAGYTRLNTTGWGDPRPKSDGRIHYTRQSNYENLQTSQRMSIQVATNSMRPMASGNPASKIPEGSKGCINAPDAGICLYSSAIKSVLVVVEGPKTLLTADQVFDEVYNLF